MTNSKISSADVIIQAIIHVDIAFRIDLEGPCCNDKIPLPPIKYSKCDVSDVLSD